MSENGKGLRDRWFDLLAEEEYRPQVEADEAAPECSRIAFRVEGERYQLYLDEKDPTFFLLMVTYRLGDLSDEPELLLEAAHSVARKLKATKVRVDQEERLVHSSCEWFSETLPSAGLLGRLLFQCGCGAHDFFEKAREMMAPVRVA